MASPDDSTMTPAEGEAADVDTTYFASYEDLSVHELMLKDRPRTEAYRDFILKNTALFKGKVVVDVGAGTGILSMFAAQAGAKKVYAIEGSSLSHTCALLARHNGYGDVIEVVHGRVEEVDLPAGVKADVMVSEWMGFYLLHESMLDSLIVARDKWLGPDGIMAPSSASLHLCPVQMKDYTKEKFDFWSDVYGFDFSPIVPMVKHQTLGAPQIRSLDAKQCLAEPQLITTLDMQFVTQDDIRAIRTNPTFTFTKNSLLHGFACWFDVEFEGANGDGEVVQMSTAPSAPQTHWEQTVILLPDTLLATKGETLSCQFELVQDKVQHRRYNITIQIDEEEEEEEGQGDGGVEIDMEDDIKSHLIKALESQNEPTQEDKQ